VRNPNSKLIFNKIDPAFKTLETPHHTIEEAPDKDWMELKDMVEAPIPNNDCDELARKITQNRKLMKRMTKRRLEIQHSIKLHDNFKILNPIYDEIKFAKAKEISCLYIDKLRIKIIGLVQAQAAKNFTSSLEQGHSIDYG
jgi:hypothetical protein